VTYLLRRWLLPLALVALLPAALSGQTDRI
jgi:hypothetical protein